MKSRYCPACGTQYTPIRLNQTCCSKPCRLKWRYISGEASTQNQYAHISGNWSRYLPRLLRASRTRLTTPIMLKILEKQNYRCALSGEPLTCILEVGKRTWTNASIDRINPKLGYRPDNIQFVCAAVNIWRGNLPVNEYVEWCKKVTRHHGKKAMRKRNYREEYDSYHSKPEQKKNRAQRNAARRELEAEGRVKKGDGKEVNHKNPIRSGGSNAKGNLEVTSRSKNRAWRKGM